MIILFGSDDVIARLSKCEGEGINLSKEGDSNFLELIKAMKKDVENPKLIKFFWQRKTKVSLRDQHINTILFKYNQK